MKNTFLALLAVSAAGSACAQDIEESFVNLNGFGIAYRESGDGEPVLFIPAAIGDSFLPMMSDPVLDGHRLITFHPPGLGHSEDYEGDIHPRSVADLAARLLRHLGIEQAHVVGHSAGGAAGLALALTNPELVHSLVLLEGGVPPAGFDPSVILAEHQNEMTGGGPEFLRWTQPRSHEEGVDAMMTWLADDSNWVEHLSPSIPDIEEQAARATVPGPPSAARQQANEQARFQRSEFERVAMPTVWLFSDEPLIGAELLYYGLRDVIPHMETEYVSGVGHGFHLTDPQPVAHAIASFIERHPME